MSLKRNKLQSKAIAVQLKQANSEFIASIDTFRIAKVKKKKKKGAI